MPTTNVLYGQSLSDMVDEDKLFEAADLNGIGITDALVPGVTLSVPVRERAKFNQPIERLPVKPTVRAGYGQAWVDIALQELGDEEKLFDLVDLNDAGITDELLSGAALSVGDFEPDKKRIVSRLRISRPASGAMPIPPGGELLEEGIEYWAIEIDFVVS